MDIKKGAPLSSQTFVNLKSNTMKNTGAKVQHVFETTKHFIKFLTHFNLSNKFNTFMFKIS